MTTIEDIQWVYNLVHSEMFYKGSSVEYAIETVFADFDGSEPADLKEKVTRYTLERRIESLEKALSKAVQSQDWAAVKEINLQIEFRIDCLIELD